MLRLWVGAQPAAIIAELITAAANTSNHTYSVSPFPSTAELVVLRKLRELIGFPSADIAKAVPGNGAMPTKRSSGTGSALGTSRPGSASSDTSAEVPPPAQAAGGGLAATTPATTTASQSTLLEDAARGDGVFCPGGSYSNMLAMLLARHNAAPDLAACGWVKYVQGGGKPMFVFISAQAHYSSARAAAVLGMGAEGVVRVACDGAGRMLPSALDAELRRCLQEGGRPLMVVATAGSTVTGAFDHVTQIAAVVDKWGAHMEQEAAEGTSPCDPCVPVLHTSGACVGQRKHIWLHVDGSWGGSTIMLDATHPDRQLVSGLHLADSFVVNPHKLLGSTHQCSTLLVKSHHILRASCASNAKYLFHQHPLAEFDLGDKLLTCGRKADSAKLWMLWRSSTTEGFGERVAHALRCARDFETLLLADERYVRVVPRSSFNVCFWYVPEQGGLRSAVRGAAKAQDEASNEQRRTLALERYGEQLAGCVQPMYQAMQRNGSLLINHNPLPDQGIPRFFRVVFNSPAVKEEHLHFILDEMPRLAIEAGVDTKPTGQN